jgi:hypothetical protein
VVARAEAKYLVPEVSCAEARYHEFTQQLIISARWEDIIVPLFCFTYINNTSQLFGCIVVTTSTREKRREKKENSSYS